MSISPTRVLTAVVAAIAVAGIAAPISVASADPSYKNCTEVRKAGKAPLLKGQPGYSSKLDRDGDGVACE
ncbi:excalibur calcium-binding domain-containing protein [Tsukamurella strandjordii]|uniref:Excalibur calcium-binding domain-containing protein n=1 Tax=Tsukamurella strandjordii TaxID=147577 RepID=A0AA90SHU4_9ACTN|nr:excalibur calcium-binding domain-containing protein [Tsukamurella strandjordii]MDP0399234.1 excalibur calcium-binding domain-containing protein [Tsukamurella strandjordii]